MNVYDKAELERIKKVNESNDRMEEFLSNQREELEKNIEPLFKVLSIKFNDRDSLGSVMDTQAVSLVHRQSISEKITFFLNRRSKESIKLKKLKQDKFIFYATGFGIKTNLSEKNILIDAHLAENERTLELIESHIEHLRDTVKNLESLAYSIKNMIELMNYIGKMPA
jgi:hypothetical protein|tara:strand:+ start:1389 stop:1892 length:504 start_codon:yes stop_codon:yes gene_type:complete